ncbi:MAG: carcinine hydrolase/isopenicillin-N N-acyltransferase family protein, partial [Clostridia bacterium]|nr:carcinine hydrolase/isopenicillin-N N-acyltransferase family protein [Clostridia bacterium]
MKRIVSALLAIASIVSLTSCSTAITKNASHTDPVKKVDYLYEISYDQYDWNVSKESLIKLPEGNLDGFGCSSVRNGNYYGRNFDFTFNNMSEFVVRSTAGKYKNIGIAIANVNSTPEEVENGLSVDQYNVLPFSIVDGINEKGVVCNANVVPVNDLVADGGSRTTGTNPGKEDYFYQFLCRYILDNAATADEALDLIINSINVTNTIDGHNCDYYTLNHADYELHYMVADANKTYVIEFVNNEVKYVEDNVMTNFYLTYGTAPDYTPHACGVERYETFKEYYSEGTSVEGMASLMRRCQY